MLFRSLWAGVGGRASDTRNVWSVWGGSTLSARGVGVHGSLSASAGLIRRGNGNSTPIAGGVAWTAGGVAVPSLGADPLTTDGDFLSKPVEVIHPVSTTPIACGTLADIHWTSGGVIGSPVPADPPSQERVVIGDWVIPFGIVPTV